MTTHQFGHCPLRVPLTHLVPLKHGHPSNAYLFSAFVYLYVSTNSIFLWPSRQEGLLWDSSWELIHLHGVSEALTT